MTPLTGKTAIVTGAGRGIGRAIALDLAQHGANVAVNYNSSAEAAADLCREVAGHGAKAVAIQADVSKEEDVNRLVDQAIAEFGQVDILVNNAGINRDRTLRRMTGGEWDEVIQTDLTSAYYCTSKVGNHMIARNGPGTIIMISSIIGRMGNIGQGNYAAAKAGMIGFSKSMAQELARWQITVNAICPGFVETDMLAGVPEGPRDAILAKIPLGRFGRPEEVAALVRYLCVDGGWMTGAVLDLNGGHYIPS